MIPLYLPSQVQDMDQRAYARGVAPVALMERAAGHLARAVLRCAGRGYGLRVGLLCGKGNNGGDGLAAARRLRDAGALPVVHLLGAPATDETAEELRRYRAAGGRMADSADAALHGADVVVDCLLGTGASGAPRGGALDGVAALAAARNRGAAVVACDVPTGVDAGTGAVPGAAVHADLTLTLGAHKRGLWLEPARSHCGRLALGELDIDDGATRPVAHVLEAGDVRWLAPQWPVDVHKRSRGVVLVLAGSPGMSGAATLVARGALAAGAGLVTVATHAAVRDVVAGAVPEALTVALPLDRPGEAVDRLREHVDRADVVAVGPGLGHAPPAVELVRRVVAEVEPPVVLDADGLNAFRGDGERLADRKGATPLVCTPHAAEFARLVGRAVDQIWPSRVTVAAEHAERWNAVVVAKGPGTVVTAPDGRTWVNPTGTWALATGGTGDVLTGVIAALVAQRPDAAQVAAAVWLHGLAGECAAEMHGPRSVTAAAVAEGVATAWRRLEEGP